MIQLILDHLWQSTLFVALAAFLTLLFKVNSARVRYGIWLSASLKFLLPLALLTAAGKAISQLLLPVPPATATIMALDSAAEPFSSGAIATDGVSGPAFTPISAWEWGTLLALIWFAGFAFLAVRWLRHWLYLRGIARAATPIAIDAPMPVKSSPSLLEPGLVGIVHPNLLLPDGVANQLSATELETIIAHEICHWRRRDNLTAALHMVVETLFWFHPLVWWLSTRLIAERENACDEAVLSSGSDPQTYAESILKVCRLYVHSPLPCASGVSGADLKRRIEAIMESKFVIRLNAAKKSLLAACAATAIAAPLALGLLTAPPTFAPAVAQTTASPLPGTGVALRHQIESMENGHADFDVMVPGLAQAARSQSERAQANIQKWGALKSITFRGNENGNDVYMVQFENQLTAWTIGPVQPDGKIGPTLFFGPAIKRDGNGPSPGLETAIRQELDGDFTGNPALEIMSPPLQTATQAQWPAISADAQSLGAVQAITFQKVTLRGWDVYNVTFTNGTETVQAAPLTDGKLSGLLHTDIVLPHQQQHPGTEASLRRYIDSLENGQPNYDEMEPQMAAVVKQQLPGILVQIKSWGALKSIVFQGGGSQGMDIYEVTFEHAKAEWNIGALDTDGKVMRRGFHQIS